jgi:hypothetical protein
VAYAKELIFNSGSCKALTADQRKIVEQEDEKNSTRFINEREVALKQGMLGGSY